MFARVREPERENKELKREKVELKQELAHVIGERDEWKDKAVEISHLLTYAAEQGNRKGLVSIKCATD